MLKIRLKRMGARQAPHYRVVVSDSRLTPQGGFVDNLGTYCPGTEPPALKIDVARAEGWIRKGALPSETVKNLLEKARALQA